MKIKCLCLVALLFSMSVKAMNDNQEFGLFKNELMQYCTYEYRKEDEKETRKERFRNFFEEQLQKMFQNTESKKVLENVLHFLKMLKELDQGKLNLFQLEKTDLKLHIVEAQKDIALFRHGLEDNDFENTGFLKNDFLKKFLSGEKHLSIEINAKNTQDTDSALVFDESGHNFLAKTSYLGMKRELKKGTGDECVPVYEIGVAYCPFYSILSHEFLHASHFLETIDKQNSSETINAGFIPYGLALRVKDFSSYNKLLSERQKECFGEIPEFDDDVFVANIVALLDKIKELKSTYNNWGDLNQPDQDTLNTLCQKIPGAIGVESIWNSLSIESDKLKYNAGRGNILNLDFISKLAQKPDWENLEELRTVFGRVGQRDVCEDSVRKEKGLPIRGTYSIPQSKRYALKSTINKRCTQNDHVVPTDYISGTYSKEVSQDEARYLPLCIKLILCENKKVCLSHGIKPSLLNLNTLFCLRSVLGISEYAQPDGITDTPADTPVNSANISSDSEPSTGRREITEETLDQKTLDYKSIAKSLRDNNVSNAIIAAALEINVAEVDGLFRD